MWLAVAALTAGFSACRSPEPPAPPFFEAQLFPNPTNGLGQCYLNLIDTTQVRLELAGWDSPDPVLLDSLLPPGMHVLAYDFSPAPRGWYQAHLLTNGFLTTFELLKTP